MSGWRLIRDAPGEGAWNMAVDEAIARAVGRATAPPTLRLYRWRHPTVSLGYGQRWEGALDRDACRRRGVGIVRRPTGGRAVLHAAEITYSASVPVRGLWGGLTVEESFVRLCTALMAAFRRLGIETALGPTGAAALRGRSAACFDLAGLPAILASGRKLVGSAQRRWESCLLQHGSILLHFDADLHRSIFPGWSDAASGRITCLGELAPACGTPAIEAALLAGWADALGPGRAGSLAADELTEAHQLVRERYGNPDWTFRR